MQIRTFSKLHEAVVPSQGTYETNQDEETLLSTQFKHPTFLMCPPAWYEIRSAANPWMGANISGATRGLAFSQWNNLYQSLRNLGDVRLIHAPEGSPDMTFVAHGAVVNYGVAALSCFTHAERTSEEDHLQIWLEEAGFVVWKSEGLNLEGEGDALFSPDGQHLWAAHGSRTSLKSHHRLSNVWHVKVTSLQLIDPRFYHLDLCFVPLSRGQVLYYPGAFDRRSLAKIEDAYSRHQRIVVTEEEAVQLSCSVINVGDDILMHAAIGGGVADRLRNAGYRVSELPLGEFIKGGGGAKSLALRLSDLCVTHSKSLEPQNPETAPQWQSHIRQEKEERP